MDDDGAGVGPSESIVKSDRPSQQRCSRIPGCTMSGRLGEAKPEQHQSPANGQLATPALSPIDEHGESSAQPFSPVVDLQGGHEYDNKRADGAHDSSTPNVTSSVTSQRHNSSSEPDASKFPKGDASKVLKLSPRQIQDLVTSPESLPVRPASPATEDIPQLEGLGIESAVTDEPLSSSDDVRHGTNHLNGTSVAPVGTSTSNQNAPLLPSINATPGATVLERPGRSSRSVSSPLMRRKHSSGKSGRAKPDLAPLKTSKDEQPSARAGVKPSPKLDAQPSPIPAVIPLPPLSLATYLQLELASDRPSKLYIHRSSTADFVYESARVKFERLLNFLLLPPHLEQVLWFGAIACLDAWLYTFTILPLRFFKAVAILIQWWAQTALKEVTDVWNYVYNGLGRVWRRKREGDGSRSRRPSMVGWSSSRRPSAVDVTSETRPRLDDRSIAELFDRNTKGRRRFRHQRSRSKPSLLLPNHKADILQGLLILTSCTVLMSFDASRMYHSIRGQSAIKLYVIYNVLEVFDRLLGAIGQDILECLFSKETLERDEHGRSKLTRPFWMFLLALLYNVIHATALFYQVVTLNVAVNSYSNALLTLLMSNQFVEIKGTVFKKFEKENLFQLTCADVVERFQLWLMLLIIALRNIVEVGGLSISLNSALPSPSEGSVANGTGIPLVSGFVIPQAFTLLPKWTGEVLGPFLIVLGSEALVDWCKHAYIGKFNNVKSAIYGRFLDVLSKDYYSHAFADQNLTKRLGLPVIPLSCLFIRACLQTYHMFLATHMPLPIPSSATGVSLESQDTTATALPATTAALQHLDQIFRRALGRSSFGAGAGGDTAGSSFSWWSIDDVIAFTTMILVFLTLYLILLAFKLLLGMLLLSYSRRRYRGMKERERQDYTAEGGQRVGGWGAVEVGEEKRRWIYDDDPEGLREMREKEERGRRSARERVEKGKGDGLEGVERYAMAAKRIW
ncbi:cytomegalovirus gH-receptor family protein [Teratosphaeria destructans]|uniref:Cytomegalovirus gH-receptor family protein n=1 Tax=Teratosphaeria destructans TaxID=418781 RepID=A0A9W7SSG0_9PEZI|nr:cytomegalovirus gH-receptor family protein [Teratosphaeria destructans]